VDPLGSCCATGGAHQRPTRTPSRCQARRAGRTTGRLESPGPPSPPQVSGGQQGAQGNPNLRSSLGSALDLSFGRKIQTPLETENIRLRKRQRDRVGAGGGEEERRCHQEKKAGRGQRGTGSAGPVTCFLSAGELTRAFAPGVTSPQHRPLHPASPARSLVSHH